MSIRICEGEEACFLYCGTTMLPVAVASFDCGGDADSFLDYVEHREAGDLRQMPSAMVELLRATWERLPRCQQCGERVVHPGDDFPDECAPCRPLCDWSLPAQHGGRETCDARGTENIKRRSTETFCAFHAAEIRKAQAKDAQEERL